MITALSLSPAVDKIYYIDNFEAGKLHRTNNMIKTAGGKGINVARVASLIGEAACSIGFKAGETGRWLEAQLKQIGVDTNYIEVHGESRTNINVIDRASCTETEILETGPLIGTKDMDLFLKVLKSRLEDTSVLVCSGGLPQGISSDFYKTIIELARLYKIKTILDTSGEVLVEGIKAAPFMVKPNLRELEMYAGMQLNSLQDVTVVCRDILEKGIEVVIASLGGEGALLVSHDTVLKAEVPKLQLVNTIGSGDSMVAGCAAGFERGYSLEEVLMLGTACAMSNTQYMEIGFISREMVEKFCKQVVIRRLELKEE